MVKGEVVSSGLSGERWRRRNAVLIWWSTARLAWIGCAAEARGGEASVARGRVEGDEASVARGREPRFQTHGVTGVGGKVLDKGRVMWDGVLVTVQCYPPKFTFETKQGYRCN